jgi:hypothetical protein
MRITFALGLGLGLALLPACSSDVQFNARYASDFAPGAHTVSVLGVFKDGRMSSDAWDDIGPRLSAPFGATCETAYGTLIASDQVLSGVIDDFVRANGPSDDLLEQLTPAATGDLILVVTVAGHVAAKPGGLPDTGQVMGGSPSVSGTGYRSNRGSAGAPYRGGMTSPGRRRIFEDGDAFEMSASLYSVRAHRAVGMVSMKYAGRSVDEAIAHLAAKMGEGLPGSRCAGWDWKARVDGAHIRELIDH